MDEESDKKSNKEMDEENKEKGEKKRESELEEIDEDENHMDHILGLDKYHDYGYVEECVCVCVRFLLC